MAKATIDFGAGFDITESPADEFNVTLDLGEIAAGGELGGFMDAPTVDATHGGSAHHTRAHAVDGASDHNAATLGNIAYGGVAGAWTLLAGNTSATKNFLTQTGNGAVSAAPAWGTIADADVPATHSGSAHHAAVTIGADAEHSLVAQVLSGVDAAAAQKGHMQLAGDLEGTAAAPTVVAASATVAGKVELATAAETTTGTDTGRAITPDGLAGSDYGKRVVGILVSDPGGDAITVGDGKAYVRIPSVLNGYNLIAVAASLSTVSSSGIPTVQIRRSRWASATTRTVADMLSTKLTIDASEFDSVDAAAAAVIDATNDDVNTGDHIYIDIDVAGTGAKGLFVEMIFQLP